MTSESEELYIVAAVASQTHTPPSIIYCTQWRNVGIGFLKAANFFFIFFFSEKYFQKPSTPPAFLGSELKNKTVLYQQQQCTNILLYAP